MHDFDNLDYLATSALFWETVINSAFTKCGKDMAKCQRCTFRESLFISRTTKCFIVRLEYLAYYGKNFNFCRGLFGKLCPFVDVLISGTTPYFIGLYWPIKVCPLRSMIWMFWTTWQHLHYLEKLWSIQHLPNVVKIWPNVKAAQLENDWVFPGAQIIS